MSLSSSSQCRKVEDDGERKRNERIGVNFCEGEELGFFFHSNAMMSLLVSNFKLSTIYN